MQSEPLLRLLQRVRHSCAAVLTAFNPGSVLRNNNINLRAQGELTGELRQLGLDCIAGSHVDPTGRWPPEEGLLVPGLAPDLANDFASRYGQVAFRYPGDRSRASKIALGYVHHLSKRTALYATVAHVRNRRGAALTVGGDVAGLADHAASGQNFGIRHAF